MSEKNLVHPGTADAPVSALLGADREVSAVLHRILAVGHTCGPVTPSGENYDALMLAFKRRDEASAAAMPTEHDALALMFYAWSRLRDLGWNDAIYCPKDGTVFASIEVGSTGIHDCHYQGEWPKGSWWTHEAGDLWPSRPSLFRLKANGPKGQDGQLWDEPEGGLS